MQVIDLRTGTIAHWLRLDGSLVTELYDVVALPGVRQPMALGFKTNDFPRALLNGERQSSLRTASATTRHFQIAGIVSNLDESSPRLYLTSGSAPVNEQLL